MKKLKIIIDSCVLFSISQKDITKFRNYQVYFTPTNFCEILTHSNSSNVHHQINFIKKKLQLCKDLNPTWLPDRSGLIRKEFEFNTGKKLKHSNSHQCKKLMSKILANDISIDSSHFKQICILDPIKISQKFAAEIEKAISCLKDYCTAPEYLSERQKYFGTDVINYNKYKLEVFDRLPFDMKTFIEYLLEEPCSLEQINKFSKSFFITNLKSCFQLIERNIIKTNRKAEKGDYFDFEFFMYICSQIESIDLLVTNNQRDFQNLLPHSHPLRKKIRFFQEI